MTKTQAPQSSKATRSAAAVGETPLMREALELARRRCDEMNDTSPAREAMKRAVLDTPADLLADLILALAPIVVAMGVPDDETTTTEE